MGTADSRPTPPDLRPWHETSRWRPVVEFALAAGLWVAALTVGLWTDSLLGRAAMAAPLTLLAGHLFTIGHDAGHGSFSMSGKVNAVVGRLAFVPSLHVFPLWRFHHNMHHRYNNLRGEDFVWTPLSPAEYRRLPAWRRGLHRLYRNRWALGLGVHYALEIWLPRTLWPRREYGPRHQWRTLADTVLLYAMVAAVGVLAYRFVAVVDPARAGDVGFWASATVLLFVVPLVGTQWLIGFVIYLNHTHPDVVWYDDRAEWKRHQVRVEGATGLRFPRSTQVLLPRQTMNHTAHHVDPAVPKRRLEEAQQHLMAELGDRITSYEWSPREFQRILDRCKLYDYAAQEWLTYDAAAA